jgi:hypothetical protein
MSLLAIFIQQYLAQPHRRRLNHPNGVGIVGASFNSEFPVSEFRPRAWKSFVRRSDLLETNAWLPRRDKTCPASYGVSQATSFDVTKSNQIKTNEMGGACGTYGGQERCIQSFPGEETGGKETILTT